MKIIGLTGGIASGKNFIAEVFKKNGAIIFDADAEVHEILRCDEVAISEIAEHFPKSVVDCKIDRKILGKIVFADIEKLQILEKIIHDRVRKKYAEFLKDAQKKRKKLAVLNIPLLLETQGYECDKVIAIITPRIAQKYRFLSRYKKSFPKNFSAEISELEEKFQQIKSKQISNSERKNQADFVIYNGLSKGCTIRQIAYILEKVSLIPN